MRKLFSVGRLVRVWCRCVL